MELLKEESAVEFSVGDVTFLVKPHATAYDRMQVVMSQSPTEFMERAIKQMVVGWKGVTQGGAAVRYSFDMMKMLPETDPKQSLMIALGNFVMEKTDIISTGEVAKNA